MTTAALVTDAATVARRNLIKIKRVPDLLVFTTLQPIMFVLLFGYVFGSLAPQDPQGYREFMMAGIFAQTIIFGATITGSGMAEDMQKGVIDRFRTLPMHPGSVLAGRTVSDLMNNVIVLVVMSLTGLVIGWRIREGVLHAAVAFGLMLLFAYAFSWVMAFVGLKVRAPEIVNNAAFIVIFPLTFVANTFVPAENMPAVLKTIAGWNPVSTITHAARENFGNLFALPGRPGQSQAARLSEIEYTWALRHAEIYTLGWIVLLLAIFVPLSTAAYKKAVAR
ncbi:ABC transporter permease [Luteipulveratus sp. YIM 133132]|uniref:Transport permease protein n=1 Tax=Luteipulveratus flavus TaxID=3031728 RepID=A0ABT6C7E9_9MICO|nr:MULTISPECIES: ABC transporter permease [unclassified Luteipulveratus]MDE9367213.1 ABC transporter permease [Luteipulveratus sp. YIM 133132]MDF8263201.1 ABC transporter permease [Luteipulveratus sp. YIM 133296]